MPKFRRYCLDEAIPVAQSLPQLARSRIWGGGGGGEVCAPTWVRLLERLLIPEEEWPLLAVSTA